MLKITSTVTLLLIYFISFSQSETSLKGTISNIEKTPIFNAEIYIRGLHKGDSLFQYSDESGIFYFRYLNENQPYRITVKYIGFSTVIDTINVIDKTTHDIILEENPFVLLDEVVLQGETPLITKDLNKTRINVANSIYSKGENGYRIMNLVPGVNNNSIQGISYRGQQKVTVYVDGVKLHMDGDQLKNYLKSIPSESIKNVEFAVITGAEYDANDTGPVIDIILKDEYKFGFSGYVYNNVQVHRYISESVGGSINYRKGIFNLQISSNLFEGINYSDNFENQEYFNSYFSTKQKEYYIERPFHKDIKIGLDTDIGKSQVISTNFEYSRLDTKTEGETSIYLINQNELDSIDDVINDKDIELNMTKIDVNYRNKIDSVGSRLDLAYNYLLYNNQYNSDLVFNYFLRDQTEERKSADYLYIDNPLKVTLHTVAGDLVKKKPSKNIEIKSGIKFSKSQTDNEIIYTDQEGVQDGRSNRYKFNENILALYSSVSKKWDSWTVNLGLRMENTDYEGTVINTNETNNYSYLSLFPSFFLQKDLGEEVNHQVSFSLNRKITRPSYQLLNPFEDIEDTYLINRGNPFLRPYFTYTGQVSWLFKSKYSLDIGFNSTDDIINDIYLLDIDQGDQTGMIIHTYENLNDEQEWYFNIAAPFKISNDWHVRAFTSISMKKVKSENENFKRSLISPYFSLNSNWNLPGEVYFEINADYKGVAFIGLNELRPQGAINFLAKRNFFNDKLSASLFVSDPFHLRKIKYEINSNNQFVRNIENQLPTTFYSFSLSFNFSEGKKSTNRENVERKDEEEQNRLDKN